MSRSGKELKDFDEEELANYLVESGILEDTDADELKGQ